MLQFFNTKARVIITDDNRVFATLTHGASYLNSSDTPAPIREIGWNGKTDAATLAAAKEFMTPLRADPKPFDVNIQEGVVGWNCTRIA